MSRVPRDLGTPSGNGGHRKPRGGDRQPNGRLVRLRGGRMPNRRVRRCGRLVRSDRRGGDRSGGDRGDRGDQGDGGDRGDRGDRSGGLDSSGEPRGSDRQPSGR